MFGATPCAILSLYDVDRCSKPTFTTFDKSQVNSVAWGTSPCIQKVDFSGSRPSARKSHAALKVFSLRISRF